MRSRSVMSLIVLGLALVGAPASVSFAAVLSKLAAPEVAGYVASDAGVTVLVRNSASSSQLCTVRVTTLSSGLLVTTSATQMVAASSTAAVAVPATGAVVGLSVSASVVDGSSPGGDW